MNAPPIKSPTEPASSTGKPKGKTNSHKSANTHAAAVLPSAWNIPPEDHDGIEITIGDRGCVVLKQHCPCADEAIIRLHPDEAWALLKILPIIIEVAERHRKEME
jgi:hypothetical protein